MATGEMMYVAGRLVPAAEATVSANDAGLLFGAGLFETLRVYGGRPFRLPAHLARLRASGLALRIFVEESDERIAEILAELIRANGLIDARVRLTATRGPLTEELADDEAPRATLLASAGPAIYPPGYHEQGVTVVVSDIRLSPSDPMLFHKSTGYMRNLLALREAHRARAAEALLFNTRNRLASAATANVFVVIGGRLLTPPVEDGALAGITRASVLELAAAEGIPAAQQSLTVDDLLEADEVFLTNSVAEVLPVVQFEQHEVGDRKPGPVTRRLAAAYRDLVARETGAA